MKLASAGTIFLGLAFGSIALAEITPVLNPSFEIHGSNLTNNCSAGLGSCFFSTDGNIPDWNTSAASDVGQVFNIENFPGSGGNPPATDGSYIADSNGPSIWQDVGTVVAGEIYTLDVDLLHRIDASFDGSIELLLGAGGLGGTAAGTVSGAAPAAGHWTTETDVFTATQAQDGETLTIVLNTSGAQGDYDNVLLTASPEPGTVGLFAAALAGLGILRRKRIV